MLVDDAEGEEAEPGAGEHARLLGIIGDAVHDRIQRGAADDHHLRHHGRAGARPRHQPAFRIGSADGGEHGALHPSGASVSTMVA